MQQSNETVHHRKVDHRVKSSWFSRFDRSSQKRACVSRRIALMNPRCTIINLRVAKGGRFAWRDVPFASLFAYRQINGKERARAIGARSSAREKRIAEYFQVKPAVWFRAAARKSRKSGWSRRERSSRASTLPYYLSVHLQAGRLRWGPFIDHRP